MCIHLIHSYYFFFHTYFFFLFHPNQILVIYYPPPTHLFDLNPLSSPHFFSGKKCVKKKIIVIETFLKHKIMASSSSSSSQPTLLPDIELSNIKTGARLSEPEIIEYLNNMNACLVRYHNMLRASKSEKYNGKISNTTLSKSMSNLVYRSKTKPEEMSILRMALFNLSVFSPGRKNETDKDGVLAEYTQLHSVVATLLHISGMQQTMLFHESEYPQCFSLQSQQLVVEKLDPVRKLSGIWKEYGGVKTATEKARNFLARIMHHFSCCLKFDPYSSQKLMRHYAFVNHSTTSKEGAGESAVDLYKSNIILVSLLANIVFSGDPLYNSVRACMIEFQKIVDVALLLLAHADCEDVSAQIACVYNAIVSAKPMNFFDTTENVVEKLDALIQALSTTKTEVRVSERNKLEKCSKNIKKIRSTYKGEAQASASVEHNSFVIVAPHFEPHQDVFKLYMNYMIDDQYARTVEVQAEERAPTAGAIASSSAAQSTERAKVPVANRPRKRARALPAKKIENKQPQQLQRIDMSDFISIGQFYSDCTEDYMNRAFYGGYAGVNRNQYISGAKRAFTEWFEKNYIRADMDKEMLDRRCSGQQPTVLMKVLGDGRAARRNYRYVKVSLLKALLKDIHSRQQDEDLLCKIHSGMRTSHIRVIDNHKKFEPFIVLFGDAENQSSGCESEFSKAARAIDSVASNKSQSRPPRRKNFIYSSSSSTEEEGEMHECLNSKKFSEPEEMNQSEHIMLDDDNINSLRYSPSPPRLIDVKSCSPTDSIGAILRDSNTFPRKRVSENSNVSIDFTEHIRARLEAATSSAKVVVGKDDDDATRPLKMQRTATTGQGISMIPTMSDCMGRSNPLRKQYHLSVDNSSSVARGTSFTACGEMFAQSQMTLLNDHVVRRIREATIAPQNVGVNQPLMLQVYDRCFAYCSLSLFYANDDDPRCTLTLEDEQRLKQYVYDQHRISIIRSNYVIVLDPSYYAPLFVCVKQQGQTQFENGDLMWWYNVHQPGKMCRDIKRMFANCHVNYEHGDVLLTNNWIRRLQSYGNNPGCCASVQLLSPYRRPPGRSLERCLIPSCNAVTPIRCAGDPFNAKRHGENQVAVCSNHMVRCQNRTCGKYLCKAVCIRFGVGGKKFCYACSRRQY